MTSFTLFLFSCSLFLHRSESSEPSQLILSKGHLFDHTHRKCVGSPLWCDYALKLRKALREWQHPPLSECHKMRFAVTRSWDNGLGSFIHIMANALQHAIFDGRVLLFEGQAIWRTENSSSIFDSNSYFEPISSCPFDKKADNLRINRIDHSFIRINTTQTRFSKWLIERGVGMWSNEREGK